MFDNGGGIAELSRENVLMYDITEQENCYHFSFSQLDKELS